MTVLRFCNALGPDLRTTHTELFGAAGRAVHPRLRPALPVHPRGRPRRRAAVRRRARPARASTTPPRDGVLALSEVASLLGRPLAPILPPVGHLAGRRGAAPARRARAGRGAATSCATAAGWTTASSRAPATRSATRPARRCSSTPRRMRVRGAARATRASRTATNARSRSSCAGARACAGRAPCNATERVAGVLYLMRCTDSRYHLRSLHAAPSDRRPRRSP